MKAAALAGDYRKEETVIIRTLKKAGILFWPSARRT